MDYHQLLAYAEREEAREAERTCATAASSTDTTDTTRDLACVRAGVIRQAQPAAAAHQQQQAARGGAERQALPDANAHQVVASRAAADARSRKRKKREERGATLDALAYSAYTAVCCERG